MVAAENVRDVPWWKEPTKDQWYAFVAAWLGWTLDAFDFTIFLLIMVPIAKEFSVPLTDVAIVFTLTLWMRLVGATAAGWMADRMGRKTPLMISILWFSVCNFIAGFSPTFWFLLLFRTHSRHRHGCRMAVRRGAGDGDLANPLARLYERRVAGLVGPWLSAVERLLLDALRPVRLARHAVDRNFAGIGDCLCPLLRQGTGGLGREQPPAEARKPGGQSAPRRDLPPRHHRQRAQRVLVPVRRLRHLLFDQRAVRDPSSKRSGPVDRVDRYPDHVGEFISVPRQFNLGSSWIGSAGAGP